MGMKETGLVIDISPLGVAQAMHMDEFPLGFLGDARVTRASEIHFNEETQLWDIILPGMEAPLCRATVGFNGYDEARKFEVFWLQNCRRGEVSPYTLEAAARAQKLREESRGV